MNLEDLRPGLSLQGVEPDALVTLIAVELLGQTAAVVYRRPDGTVAERLLDRCDEPRLELSTNRPWSFEEDGDTFRLAVEAKRMDLAFLFDPLMGIHTSNVEPLPHQITAVYESLLPRQPLRFVLADDPGAGKTIMAGLYIRELLLRADARRILVVAPGSLVEQWQEELYEKFGLVFPIYSSALEATVPGGNAFELHPLLIARLDQLSRNEDLQQKAQNVPWDLVVFDEAHKLAAHRAGEKIKATDRFRLGEALGKATRHLLLMTATPHNGNEADFQLFLSLLDEDRFYANSRNGAHRADTSDLMRRMVKEDLVRFDGTPLFPERRAHTVAYPLSDQETELYERVTAYVREEMNRAESLEGNRRTSVGFALTTLQRRLASSPEAILQTLRRRLERLENTLREEDRTRKGRSVSDFQAFSEEELDEDDLDAQQRETIEEELTDRATASRTAEDLRRETEILRELVSLAESVRRSGRDCKWERLSQVLQEEPLLRDPAGHFRKLILFTEHRDTLRYLQERISGLLGRPESVISIHGGVHRDERLRLQQSFRSDPEVRILVATDAAGEGVNLQNANLMVNYDLPWNPNRLEQRFGRIHRIGQHQVCHLWSLVAAETREGEVYARLLKKLETESEALQGRVFNILGDLFKDVSLKDFLLEAIRYDHSPEARRRLVEKVDQAMDPQHIQDLLNRCALARESFSQERLFAVREDMEKAEARKLQPHFVRSFFLQAFKALGGSIYPREPERFQITHVPAAILDRNLLLGEQNCRNPFPVVKRYERVCFTREALRVPDRPSSPQAELIHPGHPLMLAMTKLLLKRHEDLLRRGTLLVDSRDPGQTPWLLLLLSHQIDQGDGQTLSRRLQFLHVPPEGEPFFAGWAPHLDLDSPSPEDLPLLQDLREAPWITRDLETRTRTAAASLAQDHFREVAARHRDQVDRTLRAVNERLTKEIDSLTDRYGSLQEEEAAGQDRRLLKKSLHERIEDLSQRLENRRRELRNQRNLTNRAPAVLGAALVVPRGLLDARKGVPPSASSDPEARRRVETLAMEAVTRHQESLGCQVRDVSAQKCGWDLTAQLPTGTTRHIEVKGRIRGATTVTVTRNEVLCALNQEDRFLLALVTVGEDGTAEPPRYIRRPFEREPEWGVTAQAMDIRSLLEKEVTL